jgi:hypothetical protein
LRQKSIWLSPLDELTHLSQLWELFYSVLRK